MKSTVILSLFTVLATVSAHTEQLFPLRHRHARRAGHKHQHKRHNDLPAVKRGGQCQFPTDAGLVPVTPGAQNAGWAMSPDQPCLPGNYCPFACPSGIPLTKPQFTDLLGQVMAQWDPAATSYTYPVSMHGGLYCGSDGSISKPFPDKPYCVDGVGNYAAVNQAGGDLAICQVCGSL